MVVEAGPSEVEVLLSVGPVVVDGGTVVEVDEVVVLAGAVDVVEDVEDVEDVDEVEEGTGGSDVELGASALVGEAPALVCVAEPWVTEVAVSVTEVPVAAAAVGEGRISPIDRLLSLLSGSAVAVTVAAST